jgi:hypothetical protein
VHFLHALFGTWLIALLYPLVRPLRQAWFELLCVAATSFAALPLLNACTTQRHLGRSLAAGDWVFAGFDLGALTTGVVFATAAWRVRRLHGAPSPAGRDAAAGPQPLRSGAR